MTAGAHLLGLLANLANAISIFMGILVVSPWTLTRSRTGLHADNQKSSLRAK